MEIEYRLARLEDIPELERLIPLSARILQSSHVEVKANRIGVCPQIFFQTAGGFVIKVAASWPDRNSENSDTRS